jgi:hypothetical protein
LVPRWRGIERRDLRIGAVVATAIEGSDLILGLR